MARQVKPAGRYGEIGAQTKLVAVGIDEDVGSPAQGFAHGVEEWTRRLDDRGRNLLIARAHEDRHQAAGLSVKCPTPCVSSVATAGWLSTCAAA